MREECVCKRERERMCYWKCESDWPDRIHVRWVWDLPSGFPNPNCFTPNM